jgi:hypothetical protein
MIAEKKFAKDSFEIATLMREFEDKVRKGQKQEAWAEEKIRMVKGIQEKMKGFSIVEDTLYFDKKVYSQRNLGRRY